MKIGVLGTGKVAHAIASHWVRSGHDVLFGNREATAPVLDFPDGARFGAFGEAAAHGEVVLLAIPAGAMPATIAALAETLAGKVLLDCSNGLSPVDHHQNLPEISGAEEIAERAPTARVVKIFNTTGFENLAEPDFDGITATMFYATDDAPARAIAHDLAAECGFDPIYAGPLTVARDLEWLTRFWGKLAFGQKLGRRIAFKLLVKGAGQ
jgi:predicted dinucleotide-binding enzyme